MSLLSRIGIRSAPAERAAVQKTASEDKHPREEATQSVQFWLSADEDLSSDALRLAREGGTAAVRQYVENVPAVARAMSIGGIADDLMNLALDLVDWEKVARELIEDAAVDDAIAQMIGPSTASSS